jgi:pyruvate dehydrogenase E2 component (dihydrolipoamide acetyltransferase)
MDIFKLPDLGEGLPDAEIHAWFVKVGDSVDLDQPLVSMETAKAVVDVPSPQQGIVAKLYGNPGDVIKTGEPLIAFEAHVTASPDKGTVVGNLEESDVITQDTFVIGAVKSDQLSVKATPQTRLLAKKLGVDLTLLVGSGEHGVITKNDVEQAASLQTQLPEGFEALRGVRRAMLHSMVQSHHDVVPVSIFDEADIQSWPEDADITVRLIRAISKACHAEPALNAWFDTQHGARKCFTQIHLGVAMDQDEGLFVPVLQDIDTQSDADLRHNINTYKQTVADRTIAAERFKGATITLSNFGKFAGRFASPIIVPPMVAILAVGRLYTGAVSFQGKIESRRLLPLSLSFDHRAVTGGEATRFLGALMEALK